MGERRAISEETRQKMRASALRYWAARRAAPKFESTALVKAAPAAIEKAKPDPAVARLIDCFHDTHVRRWNCKPDPRHYGRMGKELKPLLSAWGEDELKFLIQDFFTTSDPRIRRSDYGVPSFLANLQYLHVRRASAQGEADERTMTNVDAAMRAMQPRGRHP